MNKKATSRYTKYTGLIFILLAMLLIHRYIFMYADDLYYCRDASYGISYLPKFMVKELNVNGRVWVHVLLMGLLRYNGFLFRIINPIIIMLTSLIIAKIGMGFDAYAYDYDTDKRFLMSTLAASILFLLLDIQITHTTIYYAACSLNYLYPTFIVMVYAYLLYKDYGTERGQYRAKWWIVLLAILSGSSTQQGGMIAIGFTILISLYFSIFENKKFGRGLIPYYIAVFSGYGIVTYGSLKRALLEKNAGKGMDIKQSITELLKTNIFSTPALGYVLVLCICCIFWLIHYSSSNRSNHKNKRLPVININTAIAFILSMAACGYSYVVLSKKYNIAIFPDKGHFTIFNLCIIAFALVYLFSLIYVSILILKREGYPFPIFCTINAIGAQIMLIVADSRFAGTYKIMFPSMLFMWVLIVYSFNKFYDSKIFISLSLFAFALGSNIKIAIIAASVFVIASILCEIVNIHFKLLKNIIMASFIVLSLVVFSSTYEGYKNASYAQNFNLEKIEAYHQSDDKTVLVLKKVPNTIYGYNVGNWNNIPKFMKECYKIDMDTTIEYLNETE